MGMGVRVAIALGALWFCLTGEGNSVGTGGGRGGAHSHQGSRQASLSIWVAEGLSKSPPSLPCALSMLIATSGIQ